MAIPIQYAAFCVIWMLVGCAAVTPSEESFRKPMFEAGRNCNLLADMQDTSLMQIQFGIMKKIKSENSLDSLDSMIYDDCLEEMNIDEFYSLVVERIQNCSGANQSFTSGEEQLIKYKLQRIACPLFIRLAAIGRILPQEFESNATALQEFRACEDDYAMLNLFESFRNWFVGTPEICSRGKKVAECIRRVTEGKLSDKMTKNMYSVSDELLSILGCEPLAQDPETDVPDDQDIFHSSISEDEDMFE